MNYAFIYAGVPRAVFHGEAALKPEQQGSRTAPQVTTDPEHLSQRQVKRPGSWPRSLGSIPDAGGEWGKRSQWRSPRRCVSLGDPAALASDPQRLRTVPRAPSPPPPRPAPRPKRGAAGGIPAISSAPRGMWPARCPTAERAEVGARRRRPVPAASGSCPELSVLLGIPGPPPLVPGDQTSLSSSPGPPGAPRLRLLPVRLPPEPPPAPRARPPAAFVPAAPPSPPLQPLEAPRIRVRNGSWHLLRHLGASPLAFLSLSFSFCETVALTMVLSHLCRPGLNEKRNVLDKGQRCFLFSRYCYCPLLS